MSEPMSEPSATSSQKPTTQSTDGSRPGIAAESLTDEAWMSRYRSGDMKAFEELFARHARAVHDFFFYMTLRREQAVQLSQETWLTVRKRRGDYSPAARFLPWLFGLAIQVRRERSPAAVADMAAADRPAAPVPPAAGSQSPAAPLHDALAAMADSYREVLVLHRLSGLGFADIAAALGATEAAVKARALQGYFQAADAYRRDSSATSDSLPPSSVAIPLSRCPETEKLINLVVASPASRNSEPLSALVRHTQDCPLCEVSQKKVEAGYQALGELAVLARPESTALEQIARAVLPTVAQDFAPQRTGWAVAVALLALLLLAATTARLIMLH